MSSRKGLQQGLQMAIIADDLTGANDSGVQLAQYGLTTSVIFDLLSQPKSGADVHDSLQNGALVIDTDSRALPREEAYSIVQRATAYVQEMDVPIIYKKIDSTLRGNISAELLAMQEVLQPELFVIAPAYPKNGRTIVDGFHYVHGQLLHTTEFSKDPQTPVKESHVPTLLGRDLAVEHISLDLLHQGYEQLRKRLEEAIAAKRQFIIFDAEQEADLEQIVQYMQRTGYRVAWVGSAGLAQYIPEVYRLATDEQMKMGNKWREEADELAVPASSAVDLRRSEGSISSSPSTSPPILTVVGSVSGVSRKQLDYLLQYREQGGGQRAEQGTEHPLGKVLEDRALPVQEVSFFTPSVLDNDLCEQEIRRAVRQVVQAGLAGYHTALYASAKPEQIEQLKKEAKQRPLRPLQLTKRIMQALAQVVAQALAYAPEGNRFTNKTSEQGYLGGQEQQNKEHQADSLDVPGGQPLFSGLIMTGGDTAKQVSLALGASGYRIHEEIEHGVPLVQMLGAYPLLAVTKAGAFGSEEVFVKAITRIQQYQGKGKYQ